MDNDGLNSLNYTVEKLVEHRLYTLITVDVKEDILQDRTALMLQEGSASGFFYDITTQSTNDNTRNDDEFFSVSR